MIKGQYLVRRSLAASVVALGALVMLFSYLAIGAVRAYEARGVAERWHDHTLEVIIAAGEVDAALYGGGRAVATQEALAKVDRLQTLTIDNAAQQRRIARFRRMLIQQSVRSDPSQVEQELASIVAEERRLLGQRLAREGAMQAAQGRNIRALLALGAALLVATGFGLLSALRGYVRAQAAAADMADSEARYRLLAVHASDLVMRLDENEVCAYVSPSAFELTGFRPEEYLGQQVMVTIHRDHQAEARAALAAVRDGVTDASRVEFRSRHRDGSWLWFEANMRRVVSPDAGRVDVVCALRDIRRRKALEAELVQRATVDELTGLANRRHFTERLTAELERASRHGRPLTLALFDIDHFKRVNDTRGHAAGDQVLRAVAAVANATVRITDLVGRIGGEEIAVLMPDTDEGDAALVAERLRIAVARHHVVVGGGAVVRVTISTGLAKAVVGEPATELMSRMDAALYAAKESGRNRVRLAA
ncbi:sensor domain-containing diguanylate cyclase [Sphingomonas lenta]|uniref:diguanylate cyclase n=1 Tax=Sphingomonas lenta TaxID=1141887 RepID=A0A2A2SID3_9SPHN|nr:sensor domain-containing diguanylate cyclase [Sphingomonas lenta]PAX08989.1 hypothetical protein CKY28_06535 [Sphingomonas lenta]